MSKYADLVVDSVVDRLVTETNLGPTSARQIAVHVYQVFVDILDANADDSLTVEDLLALVVDGELADKPVVETTDEPVEEPVVVAPKPAKATTSKAAAK